MEKSCGEIMLHINNTCLMLYSFEFHCFMKHFMKAVVWSVLHICNHYCYEDHVTFFLFFFFLRGKLEIEVAERNGFQGPEPIYRAFGQAKIDSCLI